MPAMDSTMVVVQSNFSLQSSKQSPFPLLKLPRELRDSIYHYAIAAGYLCVLRISKFVNTEASQLLSKDGVFRGNLDAFDGTDWSRMISGSIAFIQHLDLDLFPTNMCPSTIDIITSSTGCRIIRKSCVVTLNYPHKAFAPGNIKAHILYRELRGLTGFKSLVFKLAIGWYENVESRQHLIREQLHDVSINERKIQQPHRESYSKLQKYFSRVLGPAEFDENLEGHSLMFHPLEPVPEGWCLEKGDGVLLHIT